MAGRGSSMSIPMVDFAVYSLGKDDVTDDMLNDLKQELWKAFTEIGFVYLKNTGITQEEVDAIMEVSKKFFLLPEEVKIPFSRKSNTKNFGWVSSETERLNPSRPADLKEAFNADFQFPHTWPPEQVLTGFRDTQESFFNRCKELSLHVLRVMALSLGLDADVFVSAHRFIGSEKNATALRTLYYPPVNRETVKDGQLRCGEHSDYGSITLVFQSSEGGLQVKSKSGEYINAPAISGTVLINIADLMQRWTSDVFMSLKHRVSLPPDGDTSTRQSLVFFVQPDDDATIVCCDGSNKYPPVKSAAYLLERFNETYGSSMKIPVVDFAVYGLGKDDVTDDTLTDLSRELWTVFTEIGFVFLKNTGITQEEVDAVMEVSKKFFLLPEEVKKPFSRRSHSNNHGWVSCESERLNPSRPGDLKEAFNTTFQFPEAKWPSEQVVAGFREIQESFFMRSKDVALRVLRVMALSLGLDADVFLGPHRNIGTDKNGSTLRTLYYPPVNRDTVKEGQLRCGEHSDYGSITMVFQSSEGGLQVKSKSGEYINAPAISGTVLINIADLMQRWTSDVFLSVKHRVLLPPDGDTSTRQSLVFFAQPDDDVTIVCCDGSNKYPPVKTAAYLLERFNETYGKIEATA